MYVSRSLGYNVSENHARARLLAPEQSSSICFRFTIPGLEKIRGLRGKEGLNGQGGKRQEARGSMKDGNFDLGIKRTLE